MRGLRLLAASPRFLKAPAPLALRLHEAPCASAGRAPQNARGPTAARHRTLRLGYQGFGSANCAPSAPSLLHDPARSVWAYRDFGSSICAPSAPSLSREAALPCVLKHSGGLLSWRFLGCSRRDARLLRNSGRVKQSPPNRAAAPATAGLTRGRASTMLCQMQRMLVTPRTSCR